MKEDALSILGGLLDRPIASTCKPQKQENSLMPWLDIYKGAPKTIDRSSWDRDELFRPSNPGAEGAQAQRPKASAGIELAHHGHASPLVGLPRRSRHNVDPPQGWCLIVYETKHKKPISVAANERVEATICRWLVELDVLSRDSLIRSRNSRAAAADHFGEASTKLLGNTSVGTGNRMTNASSRRDFSSALEIRPPSRYIVVILLFNVSGSP